MYVCVFISVYKEKFTCLCVSVGQVEGWLRENVYNCSIVIMILFFVYVYIYIWSTFSFVLALISTIPGSRDEKYHRYYLNKLYQII